MLQGGRNKREGTKNQGRRERCRVCCRGDEKGRHKTVCPLRALPLCGFFTRSNPASAEDKPADHTVAYVLLLILFLRCFVYND